MKTVVKMFISIGILSLLFIYRCSKDNNSFGLTDFSYTGCKSGHKSLTTNQSSDDKEVIEIRSRNRYLDFKHLNVYFNCCPNKITANVFIQDSIITINEYEDYPKCNCICLYDLSYRIGPIKKGKYLVELKLNNAEYFTFTIENTHHLDTLINVNHK